MSYSTLNAMSVTIPFTPTDRRPFETGQLPLGQKPLYFAAQATHRYLQRIGITSKILRHDFTGVVEVSEVGHLRCLPELAVNSESNSVSISSHVPNCVGTVFVRLDEDYVFGEVLGFTPGGETPGSSTTGCQTLDDLVDAIWDYQPEPLPEPINLRRLIGGITNEALQILKNLPQVQQPSLKPAWAMRSFHHRGGDPNQKTVEELVAILQSPSSSQARWLAAEQLLELDPDNPLNGIVASLDLETKLQGLPVMMVIFVLPDTEQGMPVLIRLYSKKEGTLLPDGLQLIVRDSMSNMCERKASQPTPYVQVALTASKQDNLIVEIRFNSINHIERLVAE